MKKVDIDEDYVQALDYSYTMAVAYSKMMEDCEVIKSPKIKKAYDKALAAMFALYQTIGREGSK